MSALAAEDVPRLPRGVKVRYDEVRSRHVLLAPERAFDIDEIAAAILELVDGHTSVAAIADVLAARFEAPRDVVCADVQAMLGDLAAKRVIER